MGLEKVEWELEEVNGIILSIVKIPREFWEEEERNVLSNMEAPENLKSDLLKILEVTNYIYDEKFIEAKQNFHELSDAQKQLLLMLINIANGDTLCECDDCKREREEEAERINREERMKESYARHQRFLEISRNKTYEVSEDKYEELAKDQLRLALLLSRLETSLEFLSEEEPEYLFTQELIDYYYENIF